MARKKVKSTIAQRRSARKAYQKAKASSKPGAGKRFAALEKVVKLGGARDPGAVAAKIGRKKYGRKRFGAMRRTGRRRSRS
jgi:hypothetical protein